MHTMSEGLCHRSICNSMPATHPCCVLLNISGDCKRSVNSHWLFADKWFFSKKCSVFLRSSLRHLSKVATLVQQSRCSSVTGKRYTALSSVFTLRHSCHLAYNSLSTISSSFISFEGDMQPRDIQGALNKQRFISRCSPVFRGNPLFSDYVKLLLTSRVRRRNRTITNIVKHHILLLGLYLLDDFIGDYRKSSSSSSTTKGYNLCVCVGLKRPTLTVII